MLGLKSGTRGRDTNCGVFPHFFESRAECKEEQRRFSTISSIYYYRVEVGVSQDSNNAENELQRQGLNLCAPHKTGLNFAIGRYSYYNILHSYVTTEQTNFDRIA